jgi:hypothetical protein
MEESASLQRCRSLVNDIFILRVGGAAQVINHVPNKHKTQSSTPSTTKKHFKFFLFPLISALIVSTHCLYVSLHSSLLPPLLYLVIPHQDHCSMPKHFAFCLHSLSHLFSLSLSPSDVIMLYLYSSFLESLFV